MEVKGTPPVDNKPTIDKTPPAATQAEINGEIPPVPFQKGGKGIMNGGILQVVGIPLICAGIVFILVVMLNAGGFVLKKDFTTNLQNVNTTIDQMKVGLAETKTQTSNAIQEIPNTISNSVSQAIASYSSQMATITGQLNALVDKVNNNNQSNIVVFAELRQNIINLSGYIETLKTQLATANSAIKALDTRVTSQDEEISNLKTRLDNDEALIARLQTQLASNNVVITTQPAVYSLTSGVISTSPQTLTIINNGNVGVTVHLLLTLTSANTTVTSVSSAVIDRPITSSSISGTTVYFYTDVTIDANSTVTINPKVTLTYSGTSPNSFNAVWSKQ